MLIPKAIQFDILAPQHKERGPLPAHEIVDIIQTAGFLRSLVFDACKDLGNRIVDSRGPKQIGNRWALSPRQQDSSKAQPGEPQ